VKVEEVVVLRSERARLGERRKLAYRDVIVLGKI
jgi:hypothetical protein